MPSRDELLAMTPDRYLADGFTTDTGATRAGLLGLCATAAATQLLTAELAPQELALTQAALGVILPRHAGPAPARAMTALAESLSTVGNLIRQPNNKGLVRWLRDCAAQIRRDEDIPAWQAHIGAVLKQYALLASFSDLPDPSESDLVTS